MTDEIAISWIENTVIGSYVVKVRAIEALKKQIPMKPYKDFYDNRVPAERSVLVCPRCKEVEFGYNTPNYCENCGQHLDFSEVE